MSQCQPSICFDNRLGVVQRLAGREAVCHGAVRHAVSLHDRHSLHIVKYVEQRPRQLIAALALYAVAAGDDVQTGRRGAGGRFAAPYSWPCSRSTSLLGLGHGQFGGKRAFAHTGGIRLHDADGKVQLAAGDTGADRRIGADRVWSWKYRGRCHSRYHAARRAGASNMIFLPASSALAR